MGTCSAFHCRRHLTISFSPGIAESVDQRAAPDMGVNIAGQRLVGAGVSEVVRRAAEIDIEIFGPRAPIPAEPAEQVELVLDAGACRPSRLDVLECEAARLHADNGLGEV